MYKKIVILPIVLGMLLGMFLAGCAPVSTATPVAPTVAPTAVPTAAPTEAPSPTAESAAFPLTVTDSLERQVTISQRPARLISLAPSVTEMLFAVGAGDQVIGVTSYCTYPPEATTREIVGGFAANTISMEKIVSLEPDLVFVENKLQQPVIDALNELQIPVVAVAASTVAEVYDNIAFVGQVTGHPAEAAQVVTSMQSRIDAVVARLADIPTSDRLTVFWEVWDEPLMTAGPNTYISQAIELAGGVNVFSDVEQNYPQVSLEEIITRNPAVIMSPDTHGEKLDVDLVMQRPGWAGIDAVKNSRIYVMDGDLVSRAGPRLADVVEEMAHDLYPELFP